MEMHIGSNRPCEGLGIGQKMFERFEPNRTKTPQRFADRIQIPAFREEHGGGRRLDIRDGQIYIRLL